MLTRMRHNVFTVQEYILLPSKRLVHLCTRVGVITFSFSSYSVRCFQLNDCSTSRFDGCTKGRLYSDINYNLFPVELDRPKGACRVSFLFDHDSLSSSKSSRVHYYCFYVSPGQRATLPDICDLDPACLVWYHRDDLKVEKTD